MNPISIHWFRRDLRLNDNHALSKALQSGHPVLPIFIFDATILNKLDNKSDARVTFIWDQLHELKLALHKLGSDLRVFYGDPLDVWKTIVQTHHVAKVFANEDYEPSTAERDEKVSTLLKNGNIELHLSLDHVLLPKNTVLKDDGSPYAVYTPFSKKWKAYESEDPIANHPSELFQKNFLAMKQEDIITLEHIGFQRSSLQFPSKELNKDILRNYSVHRDLPGIEGTSRLGLHLRFGTISIRDAHQQAVQHSEKWLNELIWREFYSYILFYHPRVVDQAYKPQYEAIAWRNNEDEFDKWCKGQTGIPMVDAGMRELNETGFMHNRVRMIVASFLVKNLLIDWRWGEAYFAEHLLDFELASNNGGWQWAAGCGVDAAPYFRIFNPEAQQKKFDPNTEYVNRWIPELNTSAYPAPMVDLKESRKRCLEVYKRALKR
ncbi:MAG: deoxyribodipyrimidine photo-lyase [Bacteroidia bacterium]|jgi:deoxyribodipyrimidine photo-lyase